jgi:hypothetical protein
MESTVPIFPVAPSQSGLEIAHGTSELPAQSHPQSRLADCLRLSDRALLSDSKYLYGKALQSTVFPLNLESSSQHPFLLQKLLVRMILILQMAL